MLTMISAQSGLGYSLLGPFPAGNTAPDGFEQPEISYQLNADIGTPKNLGEEYRWNTPVVYYSFNQNFLDYFGSNGVFAVDQAFAFFNALSNVSSYSSDLSEFPLESKRSNYQIGRASCRERVYVLV